jgi:uncharacterized Zn-binding protein involved in type VI secretion
MGKTNNSESNPKKDETIGVRLFGSVTSGDLGAQPAATTSDGLGSPDVLIGDRQALRLGDKYDCSSFGLSIAKDGSSTVFINDLPAFRVGHTIQTENGSTTEIPDGCDDVLIGDDASNKSSLKWEEWLKGVKDAGSMTWDWRIGKERDHVFGSGSIQVKNMMDSPGVKKAREAFYQGKLKPEGYYDKQGKLHPEGYHYNFGRRAFFDAGIDPTEQFVGSYNVKVYPNSNSTIHFEVYNTTSLQSLLRIID